MPFGERTWCRPQLVARCWGLADLPRDEVSPVLYVRSRTHGGVSLATGRVGAFRGEGDAQLQTVHLLPRTLCSPFFRRKDLRKQITKPLKSHQQILPHTLLFVF